MPQGDGKYAGSSPAPGYYGGQQIDDHATRLRVLEGGYSDLNAQFAANTVQLEGLNEGVSKLIDQVGDLHRIVTSSIPALSGEIASLKSVEAARVERTNRRRSFVSRCMQGILVALSGAGVMKLLPVVWGHWHN